MDERYTSAAIRYVERNPVRAKMVRKAERYPWLSAAANCGLRTDSVLTSNISWQKEFQAIEDWSTWLAVSEQASGRRYEPEAECRKRLALWFGIIHP